jgi:hypothetical protein
MKVSGLASTHFRTAVHIPRLGCLTRTVGLSSHLQAQARNKGCAKSGKECPRSRARNVDAHSNEETRRLTESLTRRVHLSGHNLGSLEL